MDKYPDNQRLGRVVVSTALFRDRYDSLKEIQQDLTILHVETNHARGEVVMYAHGTVFDVVDEAGAIPTYSVIKKTTPEGQVVVEFVRQDP